MPDDTLQFDRVQGPAPAAACSACNAALVDAYYQAAGRVFCGSCAQAIHRQLHSPEGRAGRVVKSIAFGLGGAIAGGAAYGAVLALLHLNAALVTILIGWLVAKAMRKGAGGRGGIGYQVGAVAMTYLSIGFFATLAEVVRAEPGSLGFLRSAVICIIGAFVTPVHMGMDSILSALISALGLLQAWRGCAAYRVEVTGPHALAAAPAPPADAPPAP